MKSIPLTSGDEVQAITSERKHLTFRPGERKAVKTKIARRARKQVRQSLRQGHFE